MKLAVLGAGGFIGSRALEVFHLSEFATVCAVVRRPGALVSAARFAVDRRIADGRDRAALTRAFRGCDAVLHALAGDETTILGTLDPVYQAAQDAGVKRLVYLSSAAVHGQNPAPGTDENSAPPRRQALSYNNAKVRAERRLLALREKGRVELVILRPGIVFGPRSFWTRQFAADLLNGRAYLVNRGRGVCNSIYVDNVVYAIRLALTTADADGESFLIGDREEITWSDFYRPVAEALGFTLQALPEAVPAETYRTWPDRVESVLGSKPSLAVLSVFPDRWRRAARAALNTLWNDSPPVDAPPRASLEMTLLQQCRYKLPHTKAERILNYVPPVDFREASRRTVGWLRFAGFPVQTDGDGADSRVTAGSHQ